MKVLYHFSVGFLCSFLLVACMASAEDLVGQEAQAADVLAEPSYCLNDFSGVSGEEREKLRELLLEQCAEVEQYIFSDRWYSVLSKLMRGADISTAIFGIVSLAAFIRSSFWYKSYDLSSSWADLCAGDEAQKKCLESVADASFSRALYWIAASGGSLVALLGSFIMAEKLAVSLKKHEDAACMHAKITCMIDALDHDEFVDCSHVCDKVAV